MTQDLTQVETKELEVELLRRKEAARVAQTPKVIKSIMICVTNCKQCPDCKTKLTKGFGYAMDYFCDGTPDQKTIAGYVEWDSEAPKDGQIPHFCPRATKAAEELRRIVATIEISTIIAIGLSAAKIAREAINMAVIGCKDSNVCNEEGDFVSKFPEKDRVLVPAHHNLHCNRFVTLLVDIDEEGTWWNIRVKDFS